MELVFDFGRGRKIILEADQHVIECCPSLLEICQSLTSGTFSEPSMLHLANFAISSRRKTEYKSEDIPGNHEDNPKTRLGVQVFRVDRTEDYAYTVEGSVVMVNANRLYCFQSPRIRLFCRPHNHKGHVMEIPSE